VNLILMAAGLLLVFIAYKFLKNLAHHIMFRRGWALPLVRFLSGSHWDGRVQTDAGWKRKGTKALTQTGFAQRFYFLPRWKRMSIRMCSVFGPPAAAVGYLLNSVLTLTWLSAAFAALVAYLGFRVVKRVRLRTVSRDWLAPLHHRIAPMAGIPLSASPRSWLEVSPKRDRAIISLPESYNDTEVQRERLIARAAETLGMEEPEVTPALEGKKPTLMLEASAPPPKIVRLADVISHIKETGQDIFTLGLGKRSLPVDVSLHIDSPHLGASFGAGGGKSTTARNIAAQALYKGHIVVFLDIKRISHIWARGLPNVIYADTPELIHEALLWLGMELDRRNEVALINESAIYRPGSELEVRGNVGSRVVVVAEELNLTTNRLRRFWLDELGGQGTSPALVSLQDVAFAGRQVLMNIFFVGQMLTARVTGGHSGGNEARENMGIRMMARYTKNGWRTQAPEHPMPLVSDVLGRVQVIASGKVRETQITFLTDQEARAMGTSGVVALLPPDVPKILLNPFASLKPGYARPSVPAPGIDVNSAKELEIVSVTDPEVTGNVTAIPSLSLTEVIDQNIFPGLTLAAIRKARQRDSTFPQPLPETRGLSHVYDLGQLAEWHQMRGKKS
jgi:hypothetical protein